LFILVAVMSVCGLSADKTAQMIFLYIGIPSEQAINRLDKSPML